MQLHNEYISAPIHRVLSASIKIVMECGHLYSLDGLSNTVLSQSCILEVAPTMGIVGRKNISGLGVEGGVDKEPPVDSIWLMGQPVVPSPQCPLPTEI